jgi:hypothetical protein
MKKYSCGSIECCRQMFPFNDMALAIHMGIDNKLAGEKNKSINLVDNAYIAQISLT